MQEIGLWDLIGLAIVLFVAVEVLVLSIILFKRSKETKQNITLYFALMFLFLFFAVIFLITEQVSYRILNQIFLGDIMAWSALIASGTAGIFISLVTFDLTFPDKKRGLIIPIIILVFAYLTLTFIAIFYLGDPWSFVQEGELFYAYPIMITLYVLVSPVLFIAPIVFFYYSIVNRDNKPQSIKSFWMGLAILVFGVAYLIEIGPIAIILTVPMRLGYIFAATVLYICFAMPDWFKRAIKWEED